MSEDSRSQKSGSGSTSMFPASIASLFDPTTIRLRCQNIFDAIKSGRSESFTLDLTQLNKVAEFVVTECQANYPKGNIPIHGRMRHFEMDQIDRIGMLRKKLGSSPEEVSVALADLVIVSVLLDAGAGTKWKYLEPATGISYGRSEGLAVASLDYFSNGGFSDDRISPRVDARRLRELTIKDLNDCLQASPSNEVVGLQGRMALLQNLGSALLDSPDVFGRERARPGNIVRYLNAHKTNGSIEAADILKCLLRTLSSIWPGRLQRAGFSLGDVWEHPFAGGEGDTKGLVPFHKLSQWLSYSLVEPCVASGAQVKDLDALTGLPEYRNGGLFIDLGVIVPKNESVLTRTYKPSDELIVEWRALTVILLDQLAASIRQKLKKSASELPQANILQGGTWSAGRRIASTLRKDGGPPVRIESDGTVF